MTESTGEFFAIDRRVFDFVCKIGLNQAISYLVMARGSGGDNRTTFWSVNAVENYTGIGRRRAKKALEALLKSGAIRVTQESPRRYFLVPAEDIPGCEGHIAPLTNEEKIVWEQLRVGESPPNRIAPKWAYTNPRTVAATLVRQGWARDLKGGQFEAVEREASPPDWIWLPNALIDGAAKEIPPVELLRQTQRVAILRLFVNLYHMQSLVSDGGIHWRRIRREYSRSRVGERGAFTVWGFSPTHDSMWPDQPFVQPFLTGKFAEEDGRRRDTGIQVFWDAWSVLNDTGLVEMVGHLVEGDTDDAEIIHPCHGGEEIEQQLSDAAHRAGNALLTEGQQSWAVGQSVILVPVRSHLSAVQMMGIARLRYRPRTSATVAWFARQSEWGSWIEHYREIEQNGVQKQQQPQRVLTNVQHQGGIKGRSRGYQRKY